MDPVTPGDPTKKLPPPTPATSSSSSHRLDSGSRPPEVEKAAADPGSTFGRYIRVTLLGRGGGGEVWKAYDPALSRWVALKLLHGTSEEEIARFTREAQTAAQLTHPNIAAVHEVGVEQQRHYIAMQFVDGTTLRAAGLDPKEAARCVRDAARAVEHAHSRGIVHRDLKPDNIMVSRGPSSALSGGASKGGHLYVLDFGLARAVEGGSRVSVTGTIIGTPAYMAPEQARGSKVDARADVYSLGATLYELLAGRPPFEGPTLFAILKKVEEEEPAPPDADRDLATIAAKCLEKDPARRYATAKELADDLDRWLGGEPIHAHPPSLLYRVRKGMGRRKAAIALMTMALAVAGLAAALALPPALRARRVADLWRHVAPVLAQSESASRAGDPARARALAESGIARCRQHGELAPAYYFIGRLQAVTGDRPAAIESMDRALALDPGLREARLASGVLRAELYLATLRELKKVEENLIEAEAKRPDVAALRDRAFADLAVDVGPSDFVTAADRPYANGLLAHARGQFDAARAAFEKAIAEDALHAAALLALARLDIDMHDPVSAAKRLDRVIDVHHGIAEAYRLRGSLRTAEYRRTRAGLEAAMADLDRAIELDARSAEAYNDRAALRNYAGNLDGAIADLNDAIRLAPSRADLFSNRAMVRQARAMKIGGEGRVNEAAGEVEGSMADLDTAIRLNPKFDFALVNRAVARSRRGDLDGAFKDFEAAIAANPNSGLAYQNRSMLLYERGELERALFDCNDAVRCLPTADSYGQRALVRQALDDDPGALEDVKVALTLDEHHPGALVTRAARAFRAGRFEEAEADLDHAIKTDPSYLIAYQNRGNLRLTTRRPGEAKADFDALIRLAPRYGPGYVGRAFCHRELKDLAAAIVDFGKAIDINPNDLVALSNRGALRLADGDKKGAAADLKKVLDIAPVDWPDRRFAEKLLRQATSD